MVNMELYGDNVGSEKLVCRLSGFFLWEKHGKSTYQTISILILPKNLHKKYHSPYRVSQKKYTRLMSHNTASIASILQIRLGLDS